MEYKSEGEAWKPVRIQHNKQYYKIHTLRRDKVYYFRMSAINDVGAGEKSKVYKVTFKRTGGNVLSTFIIFRSYVALLHALLFVCSCFCFCTSSLAVVVVAVVVVVVVVVVPFLLLLIC